MSVFANRFGFRFSGGYRAFTAHGEIVTIPDVVFENQHGWNESGKDFPVIRLNMTTSRAKLRGDLYDLCGHGTGEPVVAIQ